MSKLHHNRTYLIGLIYCWFGALEVGSLIYVLFGLYTSNLSFYSANLFLLGVISLGIIGALNILALLTQTPYLFYDKKFKTWYRTV